MDIVEGQYRADPYSTDGSTLMEMATKQAKITTVMT